MTERHSFKASTEARRDLRLITAELTLTADGPVFLSDVIRAVCRVAQDHQEETSAALKTIRGAA